MNFNLQFDDTAYAVHSVTVGNQTVSYRSYENIVYVSHPVDTRYQILNLYIPEAYYEGKAIGSYKAETAPIFLPITVGGYMPGAPERPGLNRSGETNAAAVALSKGFVVAAPGVRGRTLQDEEGLYTGTAPACIVDLKAAIRYLRANKSRIPGDTNRIVSNGTSAGGALSALLGATGNHLDYEPYLAALGAAEERDDVFASCCYCPITNLEYADFAYEWMYNGIHDYHMVEIRKVGDEMTTIPVHGTMTAQQIRLSDAAKRRFPAYVNALGLLADDGTGLGLNENGEGSFKDYVKSFVVASAQKALEAGTDLSGRDWITIEKGKVSEVDFDRFVSFLTRMKMTLAFDGQDLRTPENELFGTPTIRARHFTEFSKENSTVDGELAEPLQVKLMNPLNYIGSASCITASHWRIRHGTIDRHTSLAIPTILATKLRNAGHDVDFSLPWGIDHAGDYDLDELFAWIEGIMEK